jgi:hypothetical protein
MTKRKKNKRTNNDLQNTTQKTMFPDLALLCYVLSSFMTNHRVCNYINTTGVTSGAGTANSSGAPEFIPSFWWGSCYSIFSFICMFCGSLFVLCAFSCGHCVVFSSIYGFRLPLWYLQTLLAIK